MLFSKKGVPNMFIFPLCFPFSFSNWPGSCLGVTAVALCRPSIGILLGGPPLTISDVFVIKHIQSLSAIAKQIHTGQSRLRLCLLSLVSDS